MRPLPGVVLDHAEGDYKNIYQKMHAFKNEDGSTEWEATLGDDSTSDVMFVVAAEDHDDAYCLIITEDKVGWICASRVREIETSAMLANPTVES